MELFAAAGWLLALLGGGITAWLYTREQATRAELARVSAQLEALDQRSRAAIEDREASLRRVKAQAEGERRYALEPLVRALIPVVDNFERALGAAVEPEGPVVSGVRMIHGQLLATLERQGVTAIDAEGAAFDPSVHEAVDLEPSHELPEGTVVRQWGRAFLLHDRLLRPAQVVVTRPAPPPVAEAEPEVPAEAEAEVPAEAGSGEE